MFSFGLAEIALVGSVGRKANNREADVLVVQERLNVLSPKSRTPLTEDGVNGTKTMGAIHDFQAKVLGFSHPDSRVDPGGKTLRALNSGLSAMIWAEKSTTALASPVRAPQDVPVDVPRDINGAPL